MPEQIDLTTSVFTGANPNYQTNLLPFNYGEEYLQRFRKFPYMDIGFRLRKIIDNKKSWYDNESDLRTSFDGGFNSYYYAPDECLTINVKNVDIMLNPSFGLVYDVYTMSRTYNYPIPDSGLTTPYPIPGGLDWTVINPEPKRRLIKSNWNCSGGGMNCISNFTILLVYHFHIVLAMFGLIYFFYLKTPKQEKEKPNDD
jgi:hypothetical protein